MSIPLSEYETIRIFRVTGGIYPGKYRSTSVQVPRCNIETGYETVKKWCKINFPDFNHIGHEPGFKTALNHISGTLESFCFNHNKNC